MRWAVEKHRVPGRRFRDDGQVTIFVVIAMSLFLLGFVGFAVDMTNLWFHRQMAQGAADAACQAGIMNMLVHTSTQGFVPGTGFNCSGSPSATPCQYASLNGYPGTGLVAGAASNAVTVSFPVSVSGVTPAPSSYAPVPFLRVDIQDRVRLTFSSLITFQPTSDVHAQATCALVTARAPIPIIILNPTCSRSLADTGSGKVTIIGGPTRSIQVNSSNACASALSSSGCVTSSPTQCDSPYPAATCAPSNAKIDLTQGGPNFNGSSMGTFGGPATWGAGFYTGTQATWASPASPISDPYADLPAPTPTGTVYSNCSLNGGADHLDPYPTHGCPDQTQACRHYLPGRYTIPIVVRGATAIFSPGVYYIAPTSYTGSCFSGIGNVCPAAACADLGSITNCDADFVVGTQGVVRPAGLNDGTADPTEGTMFYLSSGVSGRWGSAAFVQSAGSTSRNVDPYLPAGGGPANQRPAGCAGNPIAPTPPLPASLVGNVLMGPCTGTYGDVSVDPTTNTPYPIRGMLFFQDRANNLPSGQANFQGGGGLLLAGTLYFHNCPGSPVCQPYNTDYNAILQFQGNPGSDTRVVGNITVDSLNLAGNGSIDMVLDPNRVRTVLKATMVR